MTWESISEAQRRLIRQLADNRQRLVRTRNQASFYDAVAEDPMDKMAGDAVSKVASARTVKALVAHRILAWTGKDDDKELFAVLTEKGRLIATVSANN